MTKRKSKKYPNLDPNINLKSRIDHIDQDYLDKLSPKELEWLNKFMGEYVNASFEKNSIHKKKKHKKDCTDKNNARNRDVLTRLKASNELVELDDDLYMRISEEDELIARIDAQETRKSLKWLAKTLKVNYDDLEQKLIDDYERSSQVSKRTK